MSIKELIELIEKDLINNEYENKPKLKDAAKSLINLGKDLNFEDYKAGLIKYFKEYKKIYIDRFYLKNEDEIDKFDKKYNKIKGLLNEIVINELKQEDNNLSNNSGSKKDESVNIYVSDNYFEEKPQMTKWGRIESNDNFKPELKDIVQSSNTKSCYMLSSLYQLVKNDKDIIKNLMEFNGDKVTVHFYANFNGKKIPYNVTVDNTVDMQFDSGSAYWVRILEKAYAASMLNVNKDSFQAEMPDMIELYSYESQNNLSVKNINESSQVKFLDALSAKEITNVNSYTETLAKDKDYNNIYNNFSNALLDAKNNKKLMYVLTKEHVVSVKDVIKDLNNKISIEIYDQMTPNTKIILSLDDILNGKSNSQYNNLHIYDKYDQNEIKDYNIQFTKLKEYAKDAIDKEQKRLKNAGIGQTNQTIQTTQTNQTISQQQEDKQKNEQKEEPEKLDLNVNDNNSEEKQNIEEDSKRDSDEKEAEEKVKEDKQKETVLEETTKKNIDDIVEDEVKEVKKIDENEADKKNEGTIEETIVEDPKVEDPKEEKQIINPNAAYMNKEFDDFMQKLNEMVNGEKVYYGKKNEIYNPWSELLPNKPKEEIALIKSLKKVSYGINIYNSVDYMKKIKDCCKYYFDTKNKSELNYEELNKIIDDSLKNIIDNNETYLYQTLDKKYGSDLYAQVNRLQDYVTNLNAEKIAFDEKIQLSQLTIIKKNEGKIVEDEKLESELAKAEENAAEKRNRVQETSANKEKAENEISAYKASIEFKKYEVNKEELDGFKSQLNDRQEELKEKLNIESIEEEIFDLNQKLYGSDFGKDDEIINQLNIEKGMLNNSVKFPKDTFENDIADLKKIQGNNKEGKARYIEYADKCNEGIAKVESEEIKKLFTEISDCLDLKDYDSYAKVVKNCKEIANIKDLKSSDRNFVNRINSYLNFLDINYDYEKLSKKYNVKDTAFDKDIDYLDKVKFTNENRPKIMQEEYEKLEDFIKAKKNIEEELKDSTNDIQNLFKDKKIETVIKDIDSMSNYILKQKESLAKEIIFDKVTFEEANKSIIYAGEGSKIIVDLNLSTKNMNLYRKFTDAFKLENESGARKQYKEIYNKISLLDKYAEKFSKFKKNVLAKAEDKIEEKRIFELIETSDAREKKIKEIDKKIENRKNELAKQYEKDLNTNNKKTKETEEDKYRKTLVEKLGKLKSELNNAKQNIEDDKDIIRLKAEITKRDSNMLMLDFEYKIQANLLVLNNKLNECNKNANIAEQESIEAEKKHDSLKKQKEKAEENAKKSADELKNEIEQMTQKSKENFLDRTAENALKRLRLYGINFYQVREKTFKSNGEKFNDMYNEINSLVDEIWPPEDKSHYGSIKPDFKDKFNEMIKSGSLQNKIKTIMETCQEYIDEKENTKQKTGQGKKRLALCYDLKEFCFTLSESINCYEKMSETEEIQKTIKDKSSQMKPQNYEINRLSWEYNQMKTYQGNRNISILAADKQEEIDKIEREKKQKQALAKKLAKEQAKLKKKETKSKKHENTKKEDDIEL